MGNGFFQLDHDHLLCAHAPRKRDGQVIVIAAVNKPLFANFVHGERGETGCRCQRIFHHLVVRQFFRGDLYRLQIREGDRNKPVLHVAFAQSLRVVK
ncbi:hypothetical protein SDC9_184629 [bioreactor metagenome]|uniref:Uncharacterized protein n=1 Tax=bioreactor metagenome TaxID=1076179 RepID=A0A645HNT5_9ZZZZ